ncbi:DUF2206 domain-containing protein [Chloroflexota bacterium]
MAVLVLFGLGVLGYDLPFLRQFFGFIYLTFIPGLLIVRILKPHTLNTIDTLLYSVALSIAFVMIVGLFANAIYPLIGISRPISILPLIISLTVFVAILSIVAYVRERGRKSIHPQARSRIWTEIFSPPVLFLLLLPLLSLIGALLVNYYQNNIILLILIALIAIIVVLIAFDKFIPRKLYPLAITMIALALLWHWSLVSEHLVGWDIQQELYLQSLVLTNSVWDLSTAYSLNTTLSITMLVPISSLLLDMDAVWIFKIIFPLFYSLVPLALYQIFRKQTDEKIGFFSVFFFMSFSFFYAVMLALARMQIAELFFLLSILLLLDKELPANKRSVLLVIFAFSIVVSHYGLYFFYVVYLLVTVLSLRLLRTSKLKRLWGGFSARFSIRRDDKGTLDPELNPTRTAHAISPLSRNYIMLVLILGFIWFAYVASGQTLISVVFIGSQIYQGLKDFSILGARESNILMAMGLAAPGVATAQRNIFLVMQYITQLFIVVGYIWLLFNTQKTRFSRLCVIMALVSASILMASILVPYFTLHFGINRIYHITLFFLAPFCVLGGIFVLQRLFRLLPTGAFRNSNRSTYLKLVGVFLLIPYFLFNTGFIYEVSGDVSSSIALDPEKDYARYNEQELFAEEWLVLNKEVDSKVSADEYSWLLLMGYIPIHQLEIIWSETTEIPENAYVFLRSNNVIHGTVFQSEEKRYSYVELRGSPFNEEVLSLQDRIYDNGSAQVYR